MGPHGIGKIYGQEKNITTYNVARMNMVLHGVKDTEFEIYHGDTLTNDWDILRELNPGRNPRSMLSSPIRRSAIGGIRRMPWRTMCVLRTMAWPQNQPRISRSSCTASTS